MRLRGANLRSIGSLFLSGITPALTLTGLAHQLLFERLVPFGGPMSVDETWRELCKRVVNETDPDKLISLTQQLIIALDERKLVRSGSARDRHNEFLVDDFTQFMKQS